MKITAFNISTKKGESQPTRWLVVQDIPYPDITHTGTKLAWRNGGGLFPAWGKPATGIGSSYYCYLLQPDIEIPDDYNRTHFAGYDKETPGTITFRGKSLGEMSLFFYENGGPSIKVRCGDYANTSEQAIIMELIVPTLRSFIAQYRPQLYADAVTRVRARFDKEIAEALEEITALRAEADTAMMLLKKKALAEL